MNLSTLYRPFEVTMPWAGVIGHHPKAEEQPASPSPVAGLTDLQRRLVVLHIAQATPTHPADGRASWPGIALVCSFCFAALVIATGAWQ
jgi:hypothetical protein